MALEELFPNECKQELVNVTPEALKRVYGTVLWSLGPADLAMRFQG